MAKKLYVGNIPFSVTEEDLRALFERHGGVGSVNVITDRETGRPRGFAFVEMQDADAAEAAEVLLTHGYRPLADRRHLCPPSASSRKRTRPRASRDQGGP